MTLLQFNNHRPSKLSAHKRAHIASVNMVNTIGAYYNTATLSERLTSALSFIAMGFGLLQWALIAQWAPYERIDPALYDSEPSKKIPQSAS